jgi:recombination protein RecA
MEKEPVNVTVYASVVKNKIDKPFRTVPAYIKFGEGFDNILSIIELAVNINVIKRAGGMYTFNDGDEQLFKVLGKQQLWSVLNENEKILKKLQASLVIKEDEAVKEEYNNEQEQDAPPDEMDAMLENVATGFKEKIEAKKAKKTGTDET